MKGVIRLKYKGHAMKNIKIPVFVTTLYLFVYAIISQVPETYRLTLLLFSISPLPVLWMVYRVLRFGKPSDKTFSDFFYEDVNIRRSSENADIEFQ